MCYEPVTVCVDGTRRFVFAHISNQTKRVALFVNPSAELVNRVLGSGVIDYLQFHGEEDEAFCASFRVPYMKALRVKDAAGAGVR